MIHTNGIEAFCSILKRGYHGIYYFWSPKHIHRYLWVFCGRHNIRPLDTVVQMQATVAGMEGKCLKYCDLVG